MRKTMTCSLTRTRPKLWAVAFGVSSFLAITGTATAQDGPVSNEGKFIPAELNTENKDSTSEEIKTGWKYLLKGSTNFALTHNSGVVGAPDGANLNFGLMLAAAAGYLSAAKEHEWQNSLNWQLGFTKTPLLDNLYKNVDGLDFETVYLYHIPKIPWFGPFAAFQLKTVVFPSYAVFPDDKQVIYRNADGVAVDGDENILPDVDGDGNPDPIIIAGNTRIDLLDAFAPTTLRESLGAFAAPLDKPKISLDARLGFGFWETFVRNGYTIVDPAADIIEITPMSDVVELGPEIRLGGKGHFNELVTYGARVLFMFPVYTSVDTDLEGMEKLNIELDFNLGVKIFEWASLDYIFKAYRLPMIYSDWQIQNSLLLSLTLSVASD